MGAPKTPKNSKTGVLGAPRPQKNNFNCHFQCIIDLCGLSAFLHAFTIYFMFTLSWYMMFLVKVGLSAIFSAFSLGENRMYIKPVVGARRQHFYPKRVSYSYGLL